MGEGIVVFEATPTPASGDGAVERATSPNGSASEIVDQGYVAFVVGLLSLALFLGPGVIAVPRRSRRRPTATEAPEDEIVLTASHSGQTPRVARPRQVGTSGGPRGAEARRTGSPARRARPLSARPLRAPERVPTGGRAA
jgi:hypothetical protein